MLLSGNVTLPSQKHLAIDTQRNGSLQVAQRVWAEPGPRPALLDSQGSRGWGFSFGVRIGHPSWNGGAGSVPLPWPAGPLVPRLRVRGNVFQ